MVGSVNSGRRHFEPAVDRLAELPGWFLEAFVTTFPVGFGQLENGPKIFSYR
jgi:hypothetical protein